MGTSCARPRWLRALGVSVVRIPPLPSSLLPFPFPFPPPFSLHWAGTSNSHPVSCARLHRLHTLHASCAHPRLPLSLPLSPLSFSFGLAVPPPSPAPDSLLRRRCNTARRDETRRGERVQEDGPDGGARRTPLLTRCRPVPLRARPRATPTRCPHDDRFAPTPRRTRASLYDDSNHGAHSISLPLSITSLHLPHLTAQSRAARA
ncbi:hypothetical protein DFH06DRAFT_1353814 [Mycena polygramma]|nr:hypothetical protein DFH06DRAFT_1353814 [Mycena polygramma]